MRKLTAGNIVSFINQLDKHQAYNYINPKTKGLIKIVGIDLPEGAIRIKRWNPSAGKTEERAKVETISSEMIWRYANAFFENQPINIDRVLGGSYNTRSVLESLLAHTPEFYFCYPGRVAEIGGQPSIERGHKHIIWKPEKPHRIGVIEKIETDMVISEIPSSSVSYEALTLVDGQNETPEIDIDTATRHAQIQLALFIIGRQLGYRTWIAQNDRGIIYQDKRISEHEGVIASLRNEKLMLAYTEAQKAAALIDCIWFKNGTLMPAVLEIEHTTGVESGLNRMKTLKEQFPPFPTRYVIVAPDTDRDLVFRMANKPQYADLNPRFFPYSAVELLFSLCKDRQIKGVQQEFLDSFMEEILK